MSISGQLSKVYIVCMFGLVMQKYVQHVRFYLVPSVGFYFVVVLLIHLVVAVAIVVAAAFVGDQIPNLVPVGQVVVVEYMV